MELRINMFEIESKRVYNSGNKHLYEPFRTKDIQTIMLSKLRRMINVQGLKEKGVILDVISMHCMFGLHEIFFHWFRSVRSSE